MERSRHALLAIDAAVISLNREELDSTSSDTGSLHGARIIVTIDDLALLVRSELLGAHISSAQVSLASSAHLVSRRLGPDASLLAQDGSFGNLASAEQVGVDV